MCPYTSLWQEKVKWLCERLVYDYGFDGAYLDQITSCYVVPCFAADHGHPRGGGNTWYAGYRQMMERIQRNIKARRPDAVFTSESTIDCYLDLFDANLAREASEVSTQHSEQWLPIQLFHSVYHDYAITYGTRLQLTEKHPDAYYYGEALVGMPVAWFRQLNGELNELFDGDGRWTGDSTGFSTSTYLRWRDPTGNMEGAKRVAVKLHCLIHLAPLPQHPLWVTSPSGGQLWLKSRQGDTRHRYR
jgi:hypothetical protein